MTEQEIKAAEAEIDAVIDRAKKENRLLSSLSAATCSFVLTVFCATYAVIMIKDYKNKKK